MMHLRGIQRWTFALGVCEPASESLSFWCWYAIMFQGKTSHTPCQWSCQMKGQSFGFSILLRCHFLFLISRQEDTKDHTQGGMRSYWPREPEKINSPCHCPLKSRMSLGLHLIWHQSCLWQDRVLSSTLLSSWLPFLLLLDKTPAVKKVEREVV